MSAREDGLALSADEGALILERAFLACERVLLAVSGGADSMALLALGADWAGGRASRAVFVATVDHGLRPEAQAEIAAVATAARGRGLAHSVLPATLSPDGSRIEERARDLRYAALRAHAQEVGAQAIATAHTLDDQAETVLMRLAAGSGPSGLAAMRPSSVREGVAHIRPFLAVPKDRLVATLRARGIAWCEDAMNCDPRFSRARLRATRAALEREGLTAIRLARLADRMARLDAAVEHAVDEASRTLVSRSGSAAAIGAAASTLPDEIRLRLLGRVISEMGDGAVRLERLERLAGRIAAEPSGAATLGGARVAWAHDGSIRVTTAPARRRYGAGRPATLKLEP